jgi:hypothetical protein
MVVEWEGGRKGGKEILAEPKLPERHDLKSKAKQLFWRSENRT